MVTKTTTSFPTLFSSFPSFFSFNVFVEITGIATNLFNDSITGGGRERKGGKGREEHRERGEEGEKEREREKVEKKKKERERGKLE